MKSLQTLLLAALFCLLAAPLCAQMPQILPMHERAQLIDQILEERIEHLLPSLMEETGIDMWVLISREYNEDPVLKTLSTGHMAQRQKANHPGFLSGIPRHGCLRGSWLLPGIKWGT